MTCSHPHGADLDTGNVGMPLSELVVWMTIWSVVGVGGWLYLVYVKVTQGAEAFWNEEPTSDDNFFKAAWHLVNKSSGNSNNSAFVTVATLPGTLLMIFLLSVSSVLTEVYHQHGADNSHNCLMPIARVDRDHFRYAPSDMLVGITMFTQTVVVVCGLAAVFLPGAIGRLSAVSMAYMFPAAAIGSIIHIRQYATTLDGSTAHSAVVAAMKAKDIAEATGFDDFSTAVSVAYFAFLLGCAMFALAGLTKTLFPANEDGGGAAGIASWLGWFTGFATAAVMMAVGMTVAFNSQIHDVTWLTGTDAVAGAHRERCHVDSDNRFAHFVFGDVGDDSKLKAVTLAAAFLSLFSVIWYLLAGAAIMGMGESMVPLLVRLRGLNTASLYTSVALWSIVVFANALSPCLTIGTTAGEDMFINVPVVLLACYYASNVFRIATKLPTQSPFYRSMGEYGHMHDRLVM